jgi:hypothetical protein
VSPARCRVLTAGFVGTLLCGSLLPITNGDVNLEWRPAVQTVGAGQAVELGLYAVSDDETDQSIAAIDAILQWDAPQLALTGNYDNGPYDWLGTTGFPDDSAFDGLNDTWLDGDAYYQAHAQLGDPALATPDGLLVTTFQFDALDEGVASITIPPEAGQYTSTAVWDGQSPGTQVTGSLGSATVIVLPCGTGDSDADGDVDLEDFAAFQGCFTGAFGVAEPICQCFFDFDFDNAIGLPDFQGFMLRFSGPTP